jgi:hypothetical protein
MAEEIKKTDKELIQERIKELETAIAGGRQTGKTYRAINTAIEELFNKPIGSQIALVDTDTDKDNKKLHEFADLFAKRMQRDFPGTYFRIVYPKPHTAIAIRTSETYQETAKKRLEQWKKKLEGMN